MDKTELGIMEMAYCQCWEDTALSAGSWCHLQGGTGTGFGCVESAELLCAPVPAGKPVQRRQPQGPQLKQSRGHKKTPIIFLSIDSVKDKQWWKAYL